MAIRLIKLDELHPHPGNPRLAPRDDVIEQIAAQLHGAMDEAHALIVRPISDGYQIISGHHRKLAAERTGLTEVPCWVREMGDEEAYMQLVLQNAQGELHPLEVGLHALHSGLSLREYATKTALAKTTLRHRWDAATVAQKCTHMGTADMAERWRQLAEIRVAPHWLWPSLVAMMVEKSWTVETTKRAVEALKDVEDPPAWVDLERVTADDEFNENGFRGA